MRSTKKAARKSPTKPTTRAVKKAAPRKRSRPIERAARLADGPPPPAKNSRKALVEALDTATLRIDEQAQQIITLQQEVRAVTAQRNQIWTPIRLMYGWPVADIDGFVRAVETFASNVVNRRIRNHGDRQFIDRAPVMSSGSF